MNKIILIGNLCNDVDTLETKSGAIVGKFLIAVNRKQKSEDEQLTDFFNIKVFNALAEICKTYLIKGAKIAVMGEINFNRYTNKDGEERTYTEVIANEVEFLKIPEKEEKKSTTKKYGKK